jgi:hypothetical protein
MVEPWVEGNSLEELNLKGFNHPVLAVEILRWRDEADDVERRWPKRRGEGSSRRESSPANGAHGNRYHARYFLR